MWSTQVNRREFFELYLGSTKLVESRVRAASLVNVNDVSDLSLFWDSNPHELFSLPSLVIVGDGDVLSLLSTVVAAPQAPTPITALSRVISCAEAKQHFDSNVLPLNDRVFPAFAALIFIEAVLHGDGKLGLRQLTPLICKRTLAYAWGKAMGSRVSAKSLSELPERWLEVYSLLNKPQVADTAHRAVEAVVGGLSLLTQLMIGIKPDEPSGTLAFELLNGDKSGQERAWQRLSVHLSRPIGIEALQSLTREERGSYLQDALRTLTSIGNRAEYVEMAAACAFLATRLAPGSLEHLEILKSTARPELLAWYALFAALQHPKEILSLHGGLGFRLLRDLIQVEEKLAPPAADISYTELKIIARAGLESMAARIGHASELQVELIPYVATSFTFQLRNRSRSGEEQQSLDMGATELPLSPRARVARLAAELEQLAKELPDDLDRYSPAKKLRRKSG